MKKNTETRSIKIQGRYRKGYRNKSKVVPEIKLCGNWLEKLGFKEGNRVVITTLKRLIVISIDD